MKPNIACRIYQKKGNSAHGQPVLGASVPERCAIVKLMVTNEKSSIRADSSASRGNAMELESTSVFLLSPTTSARIDDVIEVYGYKLKIIGKSPQHTTAGALDHFQISAEMWGNE